jgi:HSP20 family molecular chaperone IbpA
MAQNARNWMWAEALDLLEEAERMHRALFRPGQSRARTPCWEPPLDLIETDEELWIQVALPGVRADQVEVHFDGDALIVTGQRPLLLPRGAGTILRLELPHGCFERRVSLPPGRYEIGHRALADGCLTLTLTKRG